VQLVSELGTSTTGLLELGAGWQWLGYEFFCAGDGAK